LGRLANAQARADLIVMDYQGSVTGTANVQFNPVRSFESSGNEGRNGVLTLFHV
jgi:hypothetical protein